MASIRIGFGLALLLSSVICASAADMPVKYKAPPLELWSWSGLYGGVNAGYSFGRDTNIQEVQNTQVVPGRVLPNGGVFGGQLGYNWQSGRFVAGLEGDAQWSGQRDSSCAGATCVQNFNRENFAFTYEHSLKWFTTARARLGLANAGTLFYVTGGAAWAGVSETTTLTVDTAPASNTANHTLTGWAAGFGIEGRVSQDWTVKAEYLHLDFGPMGMTGHYATFDPIGGGRTDGFATSSSRVTDNIVRVGLNYRLWNTASAAPLPVDPAAAAWRWTGLYAGLNAGYGVGNSSFREFQNFDPAAPPLFGELTHYLSSFAPQKVSPQGALGGGQAGYNWQFDRLVVGVEADAQWSGQKDTACAMGCAANPAESVTQQFNWLATARGRVGYADRGNLFYVTGGGAWGEIAQTDVFVDNGFIPASFTQIKGGWVAGAGIEAWLFGNWTGKVEYLHFDFGWTNHVFPTGAAFFPTDGSQNRIRNDVLRTGVNYKLPG